MKLRAALFLLLAMPAFGQVTLTTTNTVQQANAQRISIDLSGLTEYGTGQMYRDLFFADGGYFNSYYNQSTYYCNPTGSTTLSWPTSYTQASGGYPSNFFLNATYIALRGSTGATLGTGTITGNTAASGTAGPTFALSAALTSACVSGDALVVKLTANNTLMTPYGLFGNTGATFSGTCATSGAAWNTGDIDSGATNPYQTLVLPTGCTLTMYADQTMRNATNPDTTIAATSMNNIALNGSYTQTMRYKCEKSSESCSLSVNLQRVGGVVYENHTLTPPGQPVPGTGWTADTNAFTASETLPPVGNIAYAMTCTTGPCGISVATVIEASQIPANTTPLRDAVFAKLQALHPSAIRWMDPSMWCSTVLDQFQNMGKRRWCSVNNYLPFKIYAPMGFSEAMQTGLALGTDVVLSVGQMNTTGDYNSLPNLIYSDPSYAALIAAGHKVIVEVGNEAFNAQAGGSLYSGDGIMYGAWMGPNVAAFKAGAHYNSATMKIIGDGWYASGQNGPYGWMPSVLSKAQAVSGTAGLPDFMELAPYNFSNLATFTTAGASVGLTGEPWTGMFAEISNFDQVATPPSGFRSMLQAVTWMQANYPTVGIAVYEHGTGIISSTNTTQQQVDEVADGVGQAIAQAEHDMLMQQAGVTGYLGDFALTEVWNSINCTGGSCAANQVAPVWGIEGPGGMACGPANLSCNPTGWDRPQYIAAEMINQSFAGLSTVNRMACSQSGTPTYSYPGGQAGTIAPNSAVNYVNSACFSDSAGNWMTILFNVDTANSHTVTIAGQVPTGTVTQWQLGNSSTLITLQNEGSYFGVSSGAAFVQIPAKTTTSGVSYTLFPASMTILTYSSSGTPACIMPTFSPNGGTYTSAQSVSMSNSTACAMYYTTDGSTPTSGSTPYSVPISISSTTTLKAISIQAGYTNSSVQTQLYTINYPAAATPTFTPGAGTYTSTQTVTIASTTPGASITYGTSPTPTTPYSGPVTVSASETLYAFATASGYSQSATGSAAYTITAPTVATPAFSPNGGIFTAPAYPSVTISSSTGGASIFYTTDGSTPTPSSTPYTTPISVTSSLTLKAIATHSGYTNSAVGVSNPFLIYVPACFLVGNATAVGAITGCP